MGLKAKKRKKRGRAQQMMRKIVNKEAKKKHRRDAIGDIARRGWSATGRDILFDGSKQRAKQGAEQVEPFN